MCVLMQILSVGKKENKRITQISAMSIDTDKQVLKDQFSKYVRPDEPTMVNWKDAAYHAGKRADFLDARPEYMVFPLFIRWLAARRALSELYCWDANTLWAFTTAWKRYANEEWGIPPRVGVLKQIVCSKFDCNVQHYSSPHNVK